MSKPWGDPSRGISSGDVLIRPERHPACRRREAQPGSCTERENLTGDAKGKGASGSNREAESTDAPERGGLLRSSDEAGVMPVERRERVTDVGSGQPATGGTWHATEGGSLRTVARAGWCESIKSGSVRGSGCNSPGLLGTMSHRDAELGRQLWGPNLTDFPIVAERPKSAPSWR